LSGDEYGTAVPAKVSAGRRTTRWGLKVWWRQAWCGIKGHNWARWFDIEHQGIEGRACEVCGKVQYRKRGKR